MKLDYIITNNDTYSTVKEVLKAYFWVSDRLLIKLKKNNKIYLNDKITNINSPVSTRDKISFVLDFIEDNSNIVSSKISLDKDNNLRVFVTMCVTPDAVIKDLTNNLQVKIKEAIKQSSDLDVKEVNVKVKNIVAKKVEIQE